MSHESPPVLRPVPRRPFDISLTSATPPSESDQDYKPSRNASNAALSASNGAATPSDISRTRSILNLTSSTLFGIYSPTYSEKTDERLSTPFGTLTPLDTKARPQVRRKSSQGSKNSVPLRIVGYLLRSALLFGLGTAYGLLVTHLHNEHRLAPLAPHRGSIIEPSYETRYLMFWGISGVLMGSALPWVDDMWEEYFGEDNSKVVDGKDAGSDSETEDEGVAAQWTPVVRSIGAFVGIAFAIRKLPWTSTLQVSLTLALVNPFLWYLLDRSKPGFFLSTLVAFAGTPGLLALDSSLVPNPLGNPLGASATSAGAPNETVTGSFGGLGKAYREGKVDSAIWIMSVLFCSVLCFGHIGRRLALLRRRAKVRQV